MRERNNLGQDLFLIISAAREVESSIFGNKCGRFSGSFAWNVVPGDSWADGSVVVYVKKRIREKIGARADSNKINSKKRVSEEKDTTAVSSNLSNQLSGIEDTCKTFGYKKGTEKFADCMKDLYLKETGGSGTASANSSSASGADSATAAQIEALRQQTEAMRKQAEAAERARQSEALINLGSSIMNQGQPSISCTTVGNQTNCY